MVESHKTADGLKELVDLEPDHIPAHLLQKLQTVSAVAAALGQDSVQQHTQRKGIVELRYRLWTAELAKVQLLAAAARWSPDGTQKSRTHRDLCTGQQPVALMLIAFCRASFQACFSRCKKGPVLLRIDVMSSR